MTKTQIYTAIAAILTTLAETEDGWAPNGHLYAALQMADAEVYTLDAYTTILGICRQDWITISENNEVVTITPAGRDIAERLEAVFAARRAAQA